MVSQIGAHAAKLPHQQESTPWPWLLWSCLQGLVWPSAVAAKVLHPTILDPNDPGAAKIMQISTRVRISWEYLTPKHCAVPWHDQRSWVHADYKCCWWNCLMRVWHIIHMLEHSTITSLQCSSGHLPWYCFSSRLPPLQWWYHPLRPLQQKCVNHG